MNEFALIVPCVPRSKKNSQERRVDFRGRRFVEPSAAARHDESIVRAAMLDELARLGHRGAGALWERESIEVVATVHPLENWCHVVLRPIGMPPKRGATGRKRDVHNALDSLIDAMQVGRSHPGVMRNDNQVARILLERVVCEEVI